MFKLKRIVFNVLDKSEQNGLSERLFDATILILIVLNVIAVIIEPSIHNRQALGFLDVFEVISITIFTIEYLLRLWVSDLWRRDKGAIESRLLFVISPMALIDLAAILPFFIPFLIPVDLRVLRLLRVFRLFRVLKINRYTQALNVLVKVIKIKADQLASAIFVIFVLMVMASVLMYNVESMAQPDKFSTVFDAMWWAVATLTTVGYGDIFPITALGKILSSIIALLGIGLAAVPTGIIASGFTEQVQQQKRIKEEKHYCPYCGNKIEE